MEAHSFGYWLRLKRKTLDLTREGLAGRVGCSAGTIQKLEEEERRPSAQMAQRLAEIFNIPSSEQPAFLRFARGELHSQLAETQEEAPWNTPAKLTLSHLPIMVTSLIGREKEIAEVHSYILSPEIHLVTLMGPPGIGKTRLSIESARTALPDFPHGVFFVPLASLDRPALIPLTVAQAMGYVGAGNVSTLEQLKEGIGNKQLLIVLDNCEHLIEDVASLVSSLLSVCPRLKILATSRESLRVPGEWQYPVPALDVPALDSPGEDPSVDRDAILKFPALTLFAERARAVRPNFAIDADNFRAISAICKQLDGLPLAIELVAARMRLITPQALSERLQDEFLSSTAEMRGVPARQKSLKDAIDWSYELLSEREQKLFAYLSVFSGGFTLEAAETIFSQTFTETTVSALIASLFDKSLLQRSFDASDDARYAMLATIQEFARQRLRETTQEAEIRNWHLAYFLDLAEQADRELRGPNQLEWLHRLQATRDNLRAVLDWAIETEQTELALRLARKTDWFRFIRSDHNEGRQWLQRVLNMPDTPFHPEAYAEALTQLARHTWLQIGEKASRPYVEQALSIARAHADKHNIARALTVLGLVLISEKNFAAGQETLEKSKALHREVEDEWGYAHAVMCLAWGSSVQGDYVTALALHELALALFRKLGDRYYECVVLTGVGVCQISQGNLTQGVAALRDSLILSQQLDCKYEIAGALRRLGDAAQYAKRPARAVQLYWAAKNVYDSIGAWQPKGDPLFKSWLVPCRAALGEIEFEAAVEEGRALTMEQAITYAFEEE